MKNVIFNLKTKKKQHRLIISVCAANQTNSIAECELSAFNKGTEQCGRLKVTNL